MMITLNGHFVSGHKRPLTSFTDVTCLLDNRSKYLRYLYFFFSNKCTL